MSKKSRIDSLETLIERYAQACVDESWMGSEDPDDYEKIERRLKRARERLYERLREMNKALLDIVEDDR